MKRWLAAAGCGVSLVACSAGTSSSELATKTADARASQPAPSRTPGPQSAEQGAPRPNELSASQVSELRCFGKRPTMVGTPGDDRIRVRGAGTLIIVSLGGNDVISGLTDGDAVCAGRGDDRVIDVSGRATARVRVAAGPGDDRVTVVGHSGAIRAGSGDDTVRVSMHSDTRITLGFGDDQVRTSPVRRDAILAYKPCVSFRSATGPVRVNLAQGRATGQGRDRLIEIRCVAGSRFNDVLTGTGRDDEIDAGGGLDLVRTGTGDDGVSGGPRADEVHAGPGYDGVFGGTGWDRLYGGPGMDILAGHADGDYLDGGRGTDFLYAGVGCGDAGFDPPPRALLGMSTGTAPNEVFGRAGNDYLFGEQGNDRLDGGAGTDTGSGGYRDGRIDWITSVEHFAECAVP